MSCKRCFYWAEPFTLSNVVRGKASASTQVLRSDIQFWQKYGIPEAEGVGGAEIFQFDNGLRLLRCEAHWFKPYQYTQFGGEFIRINFLLEYGALTQLDNARSVHIKAPSMTVLSTVDQCVLETHALALARQKVVSLAFTEQALPSVFGNDGRFFEVWEQVKSRINHTFFNCFALTPRLAAHAKSVLECQMHPVVGFTWMHAKAIELLCLSFEQLMSQASTSVSLKPWDRQALRKAREVLVQRINTPPTMAELSLLVGINRNKLNYGFKEQFGMTPQRFLEQQRFELAMEQVRNTQKPIGQIALDLGYSNQGNFTSAFKRHFGVTPSQVRRAH